jgi:RNA polymerase sigma factor (sigma-70 family)
MTIAEFNLCVDDYSDQLYRFILKNIKEAATAEDIVQDAFEKMWIRHDYVSFAKAKSYIFTTAYHTMVDYTRRMKKSAEYKDYEEEEFNMSYIYVDLKENLERALQRIPEIQRSVVLLRDYEGYSYDEVGEITGLTENQVKVYIYRARMALRKLIGNPEVLI